MLFNEELQKAVFSCGREASGSLRIYDGISGEDYFVKVSEAEDLTLIAGQEGYFAVLHNYGYTHGPKVEISLYHFSAPQKEICKTSFIQYKATFTGNDSYWHFVPEYYIGHLDLSYGFGAHLIKIENGFITFDDDKLSWYNSEFNFSDSVLHRVIKFNNELVFSLSRHSLLYRYSLQENKIVDKFNLADKYGNPDPVIVDGEIWASDYDTLIRIKDWKIINMKRLQDAPERTSHFIGRFSFNKEKELCILARPYSGDVIGLNKEFDIKYTCKMVGQPMEAVIMQDKTVIARDWKTGTLLKGKMSRKWF